MKRTLALLLCIAMLLSYMPSMLFSANAQNVVPEDTDIEIPITPDDEVDETEPEVSEPETTEPETTDIVAECAACGKEVVWTAVESGDRITSIRGAHYILTEDCTYEGALPAISVETGATVCVNLNGFDFTTAKEINVKGTLNVLGEGAVIGNIVTTTGTPDIDFDELINAGQGGSTATYDNALFNIASANAVVNIYGGTYSVANDKPVVAFTEAGKLNVLGGEIAGTVNAGDLTLGGAANIELIETANLTVKADWTGTAVIADAILENGVAEGDFTGSLTTTEGKVVFNLDGKLATELPVVLTGITVTAPTKVEYELGEELALDGMVVTGLYSDETTGPIAEGFTVTGFDSETAGVKTITVTYGEFTATFEVTVKEAAPVESEITVVVANAAKGITVTWKATNAESFRVYYRVVGETKWTLGTETTNYSYNHTTATAGSTYEYKVIAVAGGNDIGEAVSAQITYVKSPTPTVSNVVDGVQVAWTTAAGAEAYYIYRADFDVEANAYGEFVKIGETTDAIYVDATAVAGLKYSYQVRVVSAGEESVAVSGVNILRIPAVTITSHENTAGGMKIKWNAVEGAAKYRVYRAEVKDGVWTWKTMTYFNSGDALVYTDLSGSNGVLYKYYVVGLSGTVYGPCGPDYPDGREELAVDQMRLTLPALSAQNEAAGIQLTWKKNSAAEYYEIYRSAYDETTGISGSWGKPIATTTELEYMDETAENGVKYRYTIRVRNGEFISGYKDGAVLYRLDPVSITSVENLTSTIRVTWTSNAKATKYSVYRKTTYTDGTVSGWVRLSYVNNPATSYDDAAVVAGEKYSYRITAVKAEYQSSGRVTSTYTRIGLTTLSLSATTAGVKVTVKANAMAKSYNIERRAMVDGVYGDWELVANTTELTYVDDTAEAGVTYEYRARAVNGTDIGFGKAVSVTAK